LSALFTPAGRGENYTIKIMLIFLFLRCDQQETCEQQRRMSPPAGLGRSDCHSGHQPPAERKNVDNDMDRGGKEKK